MSALDLSLKRYRRAQARLHTAFAATGLGRLCASCPDSCCGHVRCARLLLPADLAALPAEALTPVPNAGSPCQHLAASGCDLPHNRRPWLCRSHMCDRWSARMAAAQALQLHRLFVDLDAAHAAVNARVRSTRAA